MAGVDVLFLSRQDIDALELGLEDVLDAVEVGLEAPGNGEGIMQSQERLDPFDAMVMRLVAGECEGQ